MLLTDNPINSASRDRFGFQFYVRILCDGILETPNPELPISVGVFGAWGSGKSSLMMLMQEQLTASTTGDGQPRVKAIWFNPWKYDKKEDLWAALIQSILFEIAENANASSDLGKKAMNLAKTFGWTFIKKGISTITGDLISGDNLDKLKEILGKENEDHYKYINQFEEDFKEIVEEYTADTLQKRLIIFIDDLDRCLPENAITILESLKLFLSNQNTVFVIGMDHSVVELGIKSRYGGKLDISGRDYLDKIIQVPFFLPAIPTDLVKNAFKDLSMTKGYSDYIWKLLEVGLQGNPRKIKRFINTFGLISKIIKQREQSDGLPAKVANLDKQQRQFYLAKLLIFQIVFPDFHESLVKNPDYWTTLNKVAVEMIASLPEDSKLKAFYEEEDLKIFIHQTIDPYIDPELYKGEIKHNVPFISPELVKDLIDITSVVRIKF